METHELFRGGCATQTVSIKNNGEHRDHENAAPAKKMSHGNCNACGGQLFFDTTAPRIACMLARGDLLRQQLSDEFNGRFGAKTCQTSQTTMTPTSPPPMVPGNCVNKTFRPVAKPNSFSMTIKTRALHLKRGNAHKLFYKSRGCLLATIRARQKTSNGLTGHSGHKLNHKSENNHDTPPRYRAFGSNICCSVVNAN